jgi:hypothetical protein
MKVLLTLDGRAESGGAPLVMHNERLADPLDPIVRSIAAISKKRNKTEADHLEIARQEFEGGLYTNGNGPCLPGWNILRCLQDGAKKHKRGVDVLSGIYPLADHADVSYEGPRDTEALWKNGGFALRKTVGIQRSRTMRTRPIFTEWQAELLVEVDVTVWDLHALAVCWKDAGVYKGIGEMRPVYGRFAGTATEVKS